MVKGNSIADFMMQANEQISQVPIIIYSNNSIQSDLPSMQFHVYTNLTNWNFVGYQKQEGKQQLDKVCLCIAGFLQPLPFIQRLYPSLMECNDGFVDRFLICSPRPKLLLEEEVEEWCTKLSDQPLKSLASVYRLITRWHRNAHVYTFTPQAKEQYRLFANEMTVLMNSQFEGDGGEVFGNYSKDKRMVIRYSIITSWYVYNYDAFLCNIVY